MSGQDVANPHTKKQRTGATPTNSRIRSGRGSPGVRGRWGRSRAGAAVVAELAPPPEGGATPGESPASRSTVTKPRRARAVTIATVKPRILVVEDEEAISEPLAEYLVRDGFHAEGAPTLA